MLTTRLWEQAVYRAYYLPTVQVIYFYGSKRWQLESLLVNADAAVNSGSQLLAVG